ncbi:tRNA pseudouridine(55) synthase TruB [Spongiibacter sp.]|uniref:tRNA pseudouridine(55) synthase TruB n=1 Tax=Spongiibacter sp. TaxID=2024860 RepID=UPI000C58F436|nr:tRNA pseudouridine(55) synthase TruB [Spongiibacter sp.]MAY38943.1 tRNA pseudouridine(55) synthase TruB [Spongiibacter sp.]
MGRRRKGRSVSGILVLDKPLERSSNSAMIVARAIYKAAKAGHTGALDPLASGVLPICFGEATKFSQYLLDADKVYRTTVIVGERRSTGDAEGEIIAEADASAMTREAVEAVLSQFRGDILQVPPMHSALKRDGKPLYELARRGLEVEREARPVTISRLELESFVPGERAEVSLLVHCSKGTYIRSLAEDIVEALGLGGYVAALRRLQAGPFEESQALSFEQLQPLRDREAFDELDTLLLPLDSALQHIPSVSLSDTTADFLVQGQAVFVPKLPEGPLLRLYRGGDAQPQFMGIGEILDDGRVTPRRLLANM